MGRALIIPKYQPTKPTLEAEAAAVVEEEEEEQNEEVNKDGDDTWYSLGFLRKCGNRK